MRRTATNLQKRLAHDRGFTLVEAMIVITIFTILISIAVMSYAGFRDRASSAVARANIREAIPATAAYYADYGNYTFTKLQAGPSAGTPLEALSSYESGIDARLVIRPQDGGISYCLAELGADGVSYFFFGPGGRISAVLASSGPPGSTPTCA